MRIIFIALVAAIIIPAAASASHTDGRQPTAVKQTEQVRVADYYSGKKVCRRVGSATVCN